MKNPIPIQNRLFTDELAEIIRLGNTPLTNSLWALNLLPHDNTVIRNVGMPEDAEGSKGHLFFTPAGREPVLESSQKWSEEGQQHSSINKVIRKILSDNDILDAFSEREMEVAGNLIRAEMFFEDNFVIVEGEDIRKYYYEGSYSDGDIGSLKGSCMRKRKSTFFCDVYVDFAKMVILPDVRNPEKIVGRAILWPAEYTSEGVPILDRIYGSESTQRQFIRYAKSKKWWYKQSQTHSSQTRFVNTKGENIEKDIHLVLDSSITKLYIFWPYMDTFCWVNKKTGKCYNQNRDDLSTRTRMHGYETGNASSTTFAEHFVSFEGEQWRKDYMTSAITTSGKQVVPKERVFECGLTGKTHLKGEEVYVMSIDSPVWRHHNDIAYWRGNYYLKDHCMVDSLTAEFTPIGQLVYVEGFGYTTQEHVGKAKEKLKTLKQTK